MASSDAENEQQRRIWELIPLSDYRLPSAPTATSARRGLSTLKRLFRRQQQPPQGPVKTEDELHALAPRRLDAVAGPIDWSNAAGVLQAALAERSAVDSAWLIIGPPGGGYAGLVERWAAQQDVVCVPSPTYEIVAGDHSGWLADLPESEEVWALPRLERCWLRHPAGLGLVRDLFDRLLSTKLGFAVIGCDSWAWAYLRYLIPTRAVRTLTLQAFDAERLACWLSQLATGDGTQPRRFRHAQSGQLVLAVNQDEEQGVSSELRYLAAKSRGNPAAALQLWRARLRSEPDKPEAADGEEDDSSESETIWVAPALELELPTGLDEPDALILHVLLLHDGLPTEIVEGLLPPTRFRTRALLLQLAAADVIRSDPDGCWRVTAPAYGAVRSFLSARRFLVDDL